MERTYNVFVDNGLFVASHLLNKDIKDIKIEDLQNNIDLFVNIIYRFITCDSYKKIGGMAFHNSAYDQPAFKNNRKEKIKEQFTEIMNNIGEDDVCCICGKRHIKRKMSDKFKNMLNRAFFINISANTFYNNSNNLQTIDVCPICILLGMLSVINLRKSGYLVAFNSENDNFMKALTEKRYNEFIQNELIKVDSKDKGNTLNLQDEIMDYLEQKIDEDTESIEISYIMNGKTEYFKQDFMSSENLKLFNEIIEEQLLYDFNEYKLFYNLIKDNLRYVYLKKLIDYDKQELKCDVELLRIIDRRYNKLNKELNELIERICGEIWGIEKNALIEMKKAGSYNNFNNLILKWQEVYKNKKNKNLLKTQEEFDLIVDRKKYNTIKNKMMFELILNK